MKNSRPNVLAFDCFGTVFDIADVPREDIHNYVDQVRRPAWAPLQVPASFHRLPAHADAVEGIRRLREKYRVVTCSNLPMQFLRSRSDAAGIQWDAIVPLEASRAYKPSPLAYLTVCGVMQASPADVTVVTAHPDGPDAKGAPAAGMKLQVIRNPGAPQTILKLADLLLHSGSDSTCD